MAKGRVDDAAYAGRPSMCRSCGALVGAGESVCGMCGAPAQGGARVLAENSPVARRALYDTEAMRFARTVIARPAIFTIVFLIANIFLYLLMELSGGANGDILVAYGAKVNDLIDTQQQWWRFVTPVFLHVSMPGMGPLHLLVNMYGLFMLGPYVEKLYGSAKFVVFWMVTGMAGVAASYLSVQPELMNNAAGRFLFKPSDVPSAGASGALFGLVGVLFVFGIKYRQELPEGFKRAFGTGMLPMILINLFIGYVGRGFIDNAAHMGGLLAGAVIALFAGYKRPGEQARVAVVWHAVQFAALALVVVSFVMVWRNFDGPRPNLENVSTKRVLTGGVSEVEAYLKGMNEGQQAFMKTVQGDVKAVEPALQTLAAAPALDEPSGRFRDELKSLLTRAQAWARARQEKQKAPEPLEQLVNDFGQWQARHTQWITTEGEKFGLTIKEPEANQTPAESPSVVR